MIVEAGDIGSTGLSFEDFFIWLSSVCKTSCLLSWAITFSFLVRLDLATIGTILHY